jgi:hypothetical protein
LLRFALVLFAVAAAIFALLRAGLELGYIQQQPTFLTQTLILLFLSTIIIFRYLYNVKNPSQFVLLYLLLMVVKILAYLAYVLFIVLKDQPGATPNVVFFLVVYFVFTTLEITFLYRHLNAQKRP